MAEQACNPFSSPSSETDIVLLVEEEKLYVSKVVLSLVSPVFKAMLEGDFKEKNSSDIALPEKKFKDVLQFLLCVYPTTVKPVTISNLGLVLPLADEYCVESLKQRCEAFILSQFEQKNSKLSNPRNDVLVDFTLLADVYKLEACVEACVDKLMYRQYDGPLGITKVKAFDHLSSDVKFQILDKRMRLVEAPCRDIIDSLQSLDVEDTKRSISDPSCSECTYPGRGHDDEALCRYHASIDVLEVFKEVLKLIPCFKKQRQVK